MTTNSIDTHSIRTRICNSELGRYVIAGLINNVVGYGAFLIALYLLQTNPQIANLIAYAAGLQVAFFLNRFYVFKESKITAGSGLRFLLAFAIAFGLNQVGLLALIKLCDMPPEIAQLFAMAFYMGIFYLLNKYLVWKPA